MATLTKIDDQPAVSLLLVKSSTGEKTDLTNLIPADDCNMSRAQLMQLIYMLMLLVGQNMSLIQNLYAKSQMDQGKIAQDQADAMKVQTKQYFDQLQKLQEKQKAAKKWQIAGEVMKWTAVAVGVLAGALLCETPLGFIMLAAVIAFTASPLFNKAVDALGGAIGKAIGNSTWGNIIAQAIILVALTVVTCGAEGLSTGLSKMASTAAEDAAATGAKAAVQSVRQASEEASEEVAEEVSTQATKTSATDFSPRWSYASASVFTQTLMSTNILQEMLEEIPGVKNHEWAQILVMIASILVELAAACASFKAVPSASTATNQLSNIFGDSTRLRIGMMSFMALSQMGLSVAEGGQGYNTYEQSQVQEGLAPLQSKMVFGQGFFQILTQLTNLAQQTYKSLMDANRILFNTDFSADWEACVSAQHYQG